MRSLVLGLATGVAALSCSSDATHVVPTQAGDGSEMATLVVPGLSETLVATKPTTAAEDTALRRAAREFQELAKDPRDDETDHLTPLAWFANAYPHSGWTSSVALDLGIKYYRAGYFTKAVSAYRHAWEEGRTATDWKAKLIADRAAGELAEMYARVGQRAELEALFKDIGDRPMTGAGTELIKSAHQGAWHMENDPGVSVLCGPKALRNVVLTLGMPAAALGLLDAARSTTEGFTLRQVADLADRIKLSYRLVYRAPGQAIPVPSVMNW